MSDIKPDMVTVLSEQMIFEKYASHMYHAMGAYFDQKNLNGIAKWFYKNAAEELAHANKFSDYIIARNAMPSFAAINAPQFTPGSPINMFKQVLALEETVTARIRTLFAYAKGQHDYQTEVLLHWFLEEQTDAENEVQGIIDRFSMFGESGAGLAHMDEELGE